MIESIYRLCCDQCHCFGPQDVTQQQIWKVARQAHWLIDEVAGACLCVNCRSYGYVKGVVDGREAERGRCLMLIRQMTDRAADRGDQVCRDDIVDLLVCVRDGSQLLHE